MPSAPRPRYSGIIESDGLPTRPKLKNAARVPPDETSTTPTPDEQERSKTAGARLKTDREFALASASLRQALQDMPELTELSKHIMFEETKEGLNLEIVDQDVEWAPGAGRVSRVGLTGWPGFWRKAHAETPIPQR